MPGAGVEEKQTAGGVMEITVSRQELLRELTATQSVVERKTTIPILSNFLIEAADDKLTITGTDLDQSMKTSCSAKVKRPGACTIPARKLYDYIKLLGDGDISIKLLENHWVQIRAGRSNTKMVGMARANFPQVPEFPESSLTKIPSSSLKNLIAKTIFAISNEESRYTLNGALLVLKVESLTMVATDGHRLAHIEKSGENLSNISGEKKTLIPRKALAELQSLLVNSDEEYLEFADDDQTLFFRIGHRTLTSRKLTGQFPNYEAVMPRDNNKFVVVRSEDLNVSIQRVAQFADERSGAIKIRIEQNELKVSSSSTDSGESEDVIETPYSFDPIVVGFNSAYLLDFLKATGTTGEVRLEFKDAQSAGQMRPEDGGDDYKYRYIIMPMRI
ncbi:DNA polymerase III subunit beta [Alloacidobacterium sp.]|uniref:DNA polymerase III subunit beta n=1 Tax=Alloacidobacterium sp. TaxID=2951999 RepID=UPI002D41E08F|nr:DNA polymerase III subunit beta [Alloacidobacterium sp.]HYK37937.1 DNA polymerase III subunit beta [Alloacidobacterium sp.]